MDSGQKIQDEDARFWRVEARGWRLEKANTCALGCDGRTIPQAPLAGNFGGPILRPTLAKVRILKGDLNEGQDATRGVARGQQAAPYEIRCSRAKGKKIADILMSRLKARPTKRRLPGRQERPTRRYTSKGT